jgi:tetratricopeptide (TPR) repeat protein
MDLEWRRSMRRVTHWIALLTTLLALCAVQHQAVSPRVRGAEPSTTPKVKEILKEARGIAIRQEKQLRFFLWDCLPDIARLQLKAGNLDDSLAGLTGLTYPAARDALLIEIAEAMARAGRRKEAERIMQQVEPQFCCDEDQAAGRKYLDDQIRIAFIDSQIAGGDLAGARQTATEVATPWRRPLMWQKLAVAYAKAGDRAMSQQAFRDAVSAAPIPSKKNPDGAYLRGSALCEIADAQSGVRDRQGAVETLRRLMEATLTIKDGFYRTEALFEAAVREAKLGDHAAAKRLFRQAIATCDEIKPPTPRPEDNNIICLRKIATAQAQVGYYEDAMQTARLIPKDNSEVITAVAAGKAKNGDISGAVAAAQSLEANSEGRTNALVAIVSVQIQKQDLQGALLTSEKIGDPLERTIVCLKIAAAFAGIGDHKWAEITAARIRLSREPRKGPRKVFDSQQPRTWGHLYEENAYFSVDSYRGEVDRAAKLAAAAMTLSQKLGKHYSTSYAVLFEDFDPRVVRELARAHAASGSPEEALAWSRQIGSSEATRSKEEWRDGRPIEQRVAALLGTVEGILERQARTQ